MNKAEFEAAFSASIRKPTIQKLFARYQYAYDQSYAFAGDDPEAGMKAVQDGMRAVNELLERPLTYEGFLMEVRGRLNK